MHKLLSRADGKAIAIRMFFDMAVVHGSMLVALSASAVYHSLGHPDVTAAELFRSYLLYHWQFVPLSLLFPLSFALNGFYTTWRTVSGAPKMLVLARGALLTVLLYAMVHWLVLPETRIPRTILFAFCTLVVIGVAAVRYIKFTLFRYLYPSRLTTPPALDGACVLIVGGAGYIGSILVRQLLERGYRVRVLDSLVYGDGALRDILGDPRLELCVGDCRNIQSVIGAVKGMNSIIHLAAIVGDPACDQDRDTALEVNFAATRMLAEVAKGEGVRRFLFASSCSVYGATEEMVTEDSAAQPISLYAETKLDSESALLRARSHSFHPTILRLATVFGHSYRPRFDLVVNLLTAKSRQDGVITIFNGCQWRPFIHVRDVARGFIAALEAPLPVVSGQVFNLGDSRMNWTLTDVAEKIRDLVPETKVEFRENADRRNYRVSFEKVETRLGFRCRTTLEEGIREMKRAFDEGLIQNYTDVHYNNQRYLQTWGTPSNTEPVDAKVMAAFAAKG